MSIVDQVLSQDRRSYKVVSDSTNFDQPKDFPIATFRPQTTSTDRTATSKMGSISMETQPLGSYAKSSIDVLIVGTGFSGLTAAIECTRKGHNVRLLERNATVNTAGELSGRANSYNVVF